MDEASGVDWLSTANDNTAQNHNKINVVQKWLWKTMAKSGTSDTEYLERNNNEDTLVSGSPWENTQTH